MARKGRKFELAYKWLYDLDKDKYKVTSPAYLYDPFADEEREIDVLVEFKDGNNIDRKLINCICNDFDGCITGSLALSCYGTIYRDSFHDVDFCSYA